MHERGLGRRSVEAEVRDWYGGSFDARRQLYLFTEFGSLVTN